MNNIDLGPYVIYHVRPFLDQPRPQEREQAKTFASVISQSSHSFSMEECVVGACWPGESRMYSIPCCQYYRKKTVCR